jgi:hypothetical protein
MRRVRGRGDMGRSPPARLLFWWFFLFFWFRGLFRFSISIFFFVNFLEIFYKYWILIFLNISKICTIFLKLF